MQKFIIPAIVAIGLGISLGSAAPAMAYDTGDQISMQAALDEGRKLEILPYLVRLRDEANVPMVYVSHDVAELRQLATQIVMLKQGRVTSFGGVKVLT